MERTPEEETKRIEGSVEMELQRLVKTYDCRVLAPMLLVYAANGYKELVDHGFEDAAGIAELADMFLRRAAPPPAAAQPAEDRPVIFLNGSRSKQ